MKKMNGQLMYDRIKKYAERGWAGSVVTDWKYEATGEDKEYFGCLCKIVNLTQSIFTQGIDFDIHTEIYVPYDGRKAVMYSKDLDLVK